MNMLSAVIHLVLGSLNGYLAVTNFMSGAIGIGVFGAVATIWCLTFMIIFAVKAMKEVN